MRISGETHAMTQMPRRQRNRIAKAKRILEASIAVFSQMGYSGTTMDAVANAAGLSKPTLYQYFASKEVLFAAMMVGKRDDMLLAFEQPSPGAMVTQLHSFAWRYAETVMRPDFLSLARLIIGEAQRFPEIGRAYQALGPNRVLEGVMAYLGAQRDAGRLRFHDAELAAQDLWGLILSAPRTQALYEPDNQPDHATLARYIHNGLRVFLRAYSATPDQDIAELNALLAA
jgi:TetR/AcrR family transcriptional repressor of mexJK operon